MCNYTLELIIPIWIPDLPPQLASLHHSEPLFTLPVNGTSICPVAWVQNLKPFLPLFFLSQHTFGCQEIGLADHFSPLHHQCPATFDLDWYNYHLFVSITDIVYSLARVILSRYLFWLCLSTPWHPFHSESKSKSLQWPTVFSWVISQHTPPLVCFPTFSASKPC